MTDWEDMSDNDNDVTSSTTNHSYIVNESYDDDNRLEVIKVSTRSRATSVAGAIAWVIRERGTAEVQAIGAGAVNQAVKAIAIARGYLERDALDIKCMPRFIEVDIEGQERTALRFSVESYEIDPPPVK